MLASFAMHMVGIVALVKKEPPKKYEAVKIKITESPPVEAPKPLPPKPKPEPKKKPPTERVVKAPVPKTDIPIQGVSKDAVSDTGKGPAVPVGNTLMTEDKGLRMDPNAVKPLSGDLSSDAQLIKSTITVPKYTPEAQDAGLEGTFVIDVYVETNGTVTQAEARRKIGFGMDDAVLAAAKEAKFTPKRNKLGIAEAGWAEIMFKLVIP